MNNVISNDILKVSKESFHIKVTGSKITGLVQKNIQKTGARVFKNNQIFSSAIVGQTNADELIAAAQRLGNVGIDADLDLPAPAQGEFILSANGITQDQVLSDFKSALEHLNSTFPKLVFNGELEFSIQTKNLTSSGGQNLTSAGPWFDWYLLFKKQGSKNSMDGHITHKGPTPQFKETIDVNLELLRKLDTAAPIKNGNYPVLFLQPDEQIQAKIAEDISAYKYHSGAGSFAGKLGHKVFESDISIQDLSYAPQFGFYDKFDGEGVLRENLSIIENGVFKNVLYDLRNAKKYNTQSTGNGLRGYNSGITIRPYNLTTTAGPTAWHEILKTIPECLVIVVGFGGTIDENLDYSTPVQISYLAQYGEIVGLCPQLSIKSNLKDMFGAKLIGVAADSFVPGEPHPCAFYEMEVIVH